MKRVFIGLLAWVAALAAAQAEVNVVATTSSMGMLARTVGGDAVTVTVLAPPDRDAHFLQARPSMMAALRRADLLVAVGAELEVGWLPAALQGAANPRINPGQRGYFEAAAQVELIGSGGAADRSLGDVHPAGNPHINLDPERMARVARILAERLATLDAARAEHYRAHAEAFAVQVETRLPRWRERVAGAPGVVLHHKDADYLMKELGVAILGYVEAIPGIPPSAHHLSSLVEALRGQPGVILHARHQPAQGAQFLGRNLNWPVKALPIDPPIEAGAEEYFALIEAWVEAIAAGRP